MAIQLCRGVRDGYTLSFDKISTTYPIRLDGTYVDGDKLLIIVNGRYSLYTPLSAPYTDEEHGFIVDNGDGTVTMTPLRIVGFGSGVDGYVATYADLPTCDSSTDGQIYQVGEYPNSNWYQCTCSGGSCGWSTSTNPVCEEIDDLLELPDTPCSGSKIYYGSFAADGSNIFYGCVAGTWLDVVNPNDTLSQEGSACLGLPMTINFVINELYSPPRNKITSFNFTVIDNSSFGYDVIGTIDNTKNIITATIPYGTDITSITPDITILGARVSPNTLVVNDFTNEVIYTCYSSSGTTRKYTVKVEVASPGDCEISNFWFSEDNNSSYLQSDFYGDISGTDITVNLPYGITTSSLIANFDTTAKSVKIGSIVQTSGTTVNDFSSTVTYICYDNNDSTITYTVNVYTSDDATNKLISSFVFRSVDNKIFSEDYIGVIDDDSNTIKITVPERSNFSSLVPTIKITGVSVSTKSRKPSNFSTDDTATFSVTPSSGTPRVYTATITAEDDPKQKIDVIYYSDDNTADEGGDITPSGWSNVTMSLNFPNEIKDLLNNVSSHLNKIKSFLSVSKAALNIAKVLLTGVGNPVLAAFDFFLVELITFINNLKNSGFFYCQIIPDTKLFYEIFIDQTVLNPHYRDGKLEKLLSEMTVAERKVYDKLVLSTRVIEFFNFQKVNNFAITGTQATSENDPITSTTDPQAMKEMTTELEVLKTLDNDESRLRVLEAKYIKNQLMSGFWLLPGDSALELYSKSFDNINDYDQPLFNPPVPIKNYSYYSGGKIDFKSAPTLLDKESVLAGGMILWLGFGGGSDLVKAIKTFIEIIRQLVYFFNDPKLKALGLEFQELQNRFWSAWQKNHKYYIGDVVTRVEEQTVRISSLSEETRTLDKFKYVCTSVGPDGYGTSGSSEPTWPETYKGVVTDNDIVWTESSITDFTVREDQAKFWQKRKLFRDWFPSGGQVLDELENLLIGFRDKIPTGYESITNAIEYIEGRLEEIESLINLIETFISLVDSFNKLSDYDMRGYAVPVQNAGISKLIDGALDENDPNKPSSSDYTLSLFSFIGTGASIPGYLLLVNLLFGNSSSGKFKNSISQATFPWGLDTLDDSPFPDENTLKKRFFDEDKVTSEIEAESDIIVTNTPF